MRRAIIVATAILALSSAAHAIMSDAQRMVGAYCGRIWTDPNWQISIQCLRVVAGADHRTVMLGRDEYAVIVRRAD